MTETLIVIVITTFVFLALIVSMARNNQNTSSGSLTGIATILASLGGLVIYGVAYNEIIDNNLVAIINTLEATICMFLGKNELDNIINASIMRSDIGVIIFWMAHLLAIYATTNAVLATIGSGALKHLRVWIRRFRKNIIIIYGINEYSMSLCEDLSLDKSNSVLFVDSCISSENIQLLKEAGFLHYETEEAIHADVSFLKRVGISKHKQIYAYIMSDNENINFDYALKLRDSLHKMKIKYDNTSLTLIANMEMRYGEKLQAFDKQYGFGSVMVIDRAYLTAHVLVKEYPPCNYIEFDNEQCTAKEGQVFHAIIIGFGKIGQSVLKNLVINGQFEGAKFKLSIIDPQCEKITGAILSNNKTFLDTYDISFKSIDARGYEFYEYLQQNISEIGCIAVCTGDNKINSEIATDIQGALKHMNNHADIFQCSYDKIVLLKDGNDEKPASLKITNLYNSDNLNTKKADKVAMMINHAYRQGISPESDWNKARFIDRMSCRASADFAPSFLKIAGVDEDDVIKNGLDMLSEKQLTNLSITEHLRWNAFHYSLGYSKMSDEVFEELCEEYLKQKENGEKPKVMIQKDVRRYMHICLVDWDELDVLSEKYREITGDTTKDYKREDTNNVLMLGKLLKKSYAEAMLK